MSWVVDTSVLLDIRLPDPVFGTGSAQCLSERLESGLVICPVTFVELAPAFSGNRDLQEAFLREVGVDWLVSWSWTDTIAAHQLWSEHVTQKRAGGPVKRPIADILIEAFARRFEGLITRNPRHFSSVQVVVP
jgi:predicted nucleic acid-binding protein